jgi:serine/threonine-protein kinase
VAIKCPKCHADNTDTARFCSNCATSLGTPRDHGPSITKTLESPAYIVAPGTVIAGHYEVQEKLGQGGMGEVYRALDKNLGRQVAIKILPEEFSRDPERLARFEREAKLLATLNHPNIAAVYGFEEAKGLRFLVMELVEGQTLQTRLDKGALPVDEALGTCRQVAEGLEAAHERGVVHRDLKPGNIMITPEGKVKILDFGLAKAYTGESTGIDIANSPTITAQMTEPGVILGTAAYMSPEQARGRSVDKRADIWAFGCILYECLTGERAFRGETVSDTLAHILKGEPDWKLLPQDTPVNVRNVLERCLQKDLRHRIHDVADARLEIEAPVAYFPEMVTSRRFLPPWLVTGGAVLLVAGIFVVWELTKYFRPAHAGAGVSAIIKVESGHWLDGKRRVQEAQRPVLTAMAISSEGDFVVYSAIEEYPGPLAKPQLHLRRIDQLEAKPIPGTEGGVNPFLSPDDRWVGFWADNHLKKVRVEGGVPAILCDSWGIFGASWGRDNSIVFAEESNDCLTRVSANSGKPETITMPDPKRQETRHLMPFWLPDGQAVLFTVMRDFYDTYPWVAVLQLKTRKWHKILEDAANPKYVAGGYLVFLRRGVLMAARFDPDKLELMSQPYPIGANVMQDLSGTEGNSGAGQFAISNSGALVYVTGGVLPPLQNSLVWVDHKGMEHPAAPIRLPFSTARLSPDGQRIAYATSGKEKHIGVYDINTGTNATLTINGKASDPIWTQEGKRLVFGMMDSDSIVFNLYTQPFDGRSAMERLTSSETSKWASSWARNTDTVAFVEYLPISSAGFYLGILELNSGRARPFQTPQLGGVCPEISPDGRWIAYHSDESNQNEVYVRPFSGTGGKWQISNNGGCQPLWARDGKQLFYRWRNQIWVVDVRTEGGFSFTNRRMLCEGPGYATSGVTRLYDLSLDGQRFLMVKLEERKPAPATEMILVQNWFEELRRLAPVSKK